MSTHHWTCGNRLLPADEVSKILNPADPLTPAHARREMCRTGISEARGYPADQVPAYTAGRPGTGKWGYT